MFWINVKRVFRSGFINFIRNGIVSFSAVLIMTITLFILATVLFTSAIVNHSLTELKNSVDINFNLVKNAPQEKVDALVADLKNLPEVESVTYVSADEALDKYVERIKDNPSALAALNELDENPLPASVNVRTKEIGQYAGIQSFINEKYPKTDLNSIIFEDNYRAKEVVINKLVAISDALRYFGMLIMIMFVVLSILITLNTIRLAIYISKDEVNVMNLVGAEHSYISGPFIVTGALYGVIASMVVLIALYPISFAVGPKISSALFDFNMFSYYISNFGQIFLIILFSGLFIGAVSSFFAIKKYLKY